MIRHVLRALPRWAILALSALLLAGCAGAVPYRESLLEGTPQAENRVEASTFSVPVDATGVYLHVQALLGEGALGFVLADPAGEIRWQGRITPGAAEPDTRNATDAAQRRGFDQERFFDPVAGDWRLVLTLESATGSYTVTWRAIGVE